MNSLFSRFYYWVVSNNEDYWLNFDYWSQRCLINVRSALVVADYSMVWMRSWRFVSTDATCWDYVDIGESTEALDCCCTHQRGLSRAFCFVHRCKINLNILIMEFLALDVVGTWLWRTIHSISVGCHDLDLSRFSKQSLFEIDCARSFPLKTLTRWITLSLWPFLLDTAFEWIDSNRLPLLTTARNIYGFLSITGFQKLAKLIKLLLGHPVRIDGAVIDT